MFVELFSVFVFDKLTSLLCFGGIGGGVEPAFGFSTCFGGTGGGVFFCAVVGDSVAGVDVGGDGFDSGAAFCCAFAY